MSAIIQEATVGRVKRGPTSILGVAILDFLH